MSHRQDARDAAMDERLAAYAEGRKDEAEASAALVAELAEALRFFVGHPGVVQLCTRTSRVMNRAIAALAKVRP